MPSQQFKTACERLSGLIDPGGQEERRWAKDEGAKLNQAVEWAKQFFLEQGEFELADAASPKTEARALVLRHLGRKQDVATIFFKVGQGHLMIWPKVEEGSGFSTYPLTQEGREIQALDEAWVDEALAKIVGRIRFAA